MLKTCVRFKVFSQIDYLEKTLNIFAFRNCIINADVKKIKLISQHCIFHKIYKLLVPIILHLFLDLDPFFLDPESACGTAISTNQILRLPLDNETQLYHPNMVLKKFVFFISTFEYFETRLGWHSTRKFIKTPKRQFDTNNKLTQTNFGSVLVENK